GLRDAATRIAEDPKALDELFDGSPLPPAKTPTTDSKEGASA
ncbi:MAG TPA: ornithine aminomutase, partial [Cutibacterium acnes]|nr:ornithine aminomutase [Cutibacterium acnes]